VTLALAVTTAAPFSAPTALLLLCRQSTARAADINAAAAGALNAYAADNAAADMNSSDVAAARAALDQLGEPVDDAGKLAKGIAQYNAHEYEESVATLQTVNSDQLSAQGKQSLTDTLAKASAAADQRKDARAEFEKGEQALAANQPGAAMDHYKAAAANTYADDGTVAKAKEQEAVAQEGIKKASADMKGLYGDAINDFKAGNLADAKTKFTTLQDAGFRAPLFQRSPGDYLNDINQKMAAMPAPAPMPAPAQATAPPASPAVAPVVASTAADTTAAPTASAATEPTTMPMAQAPATQPAAPEVAAAPTPPPAPNPGDAYHLARQQYNKGDWISARQNFMIARDGGYKAGLFEDSPAKYLARMDKKEQADDQRHQEEIRQQQMLAAAAAASAQPAAPVTAEAAPTTAEAAASPATAPATESAAASPLPTISDRPAANASPNASPATAPAMAEASNAAMPATAPTTSEANASPEAATAPAVSTAQQELAQIAEAQRIKQEQMAFEAKQKIADAKDAKAQNRLDDALNLYTQAVALDPTNVDAINGRNDLLTLTSRKPGPSNALDREAREVEARRQSIQYSFGIAIDEAQNDIEAKKIADAKVAIERARVARNTDPQIFTDDEMRAFDSRIAGTEAALDTASAQLSQEELDKQQAETAARLASQQQARENQKVQTIADLIGNARTLTEQGRYREALSVIDQILVIDPGNDYAVGVRPLVEDRADFAEQRKYREDFDHSFTTILNQAEEKRIPYNDILRYPENWPDLTETRERSVAAERGEQVGDQAVAAQLDRRLPDIKFDAVGFSDVIDFLRDLTSANIFVNWRALEAAGVDKNAPVTARLRDVPFAKVLRTILDDVSGGTTKLGYTIDEGVITISTEDDLAKNTSTRVYDIRDLIIDVPDFTDAPKFDLTQSQGNGGGTTIGGGAGGGGQQGGGNLFGGGGGNGETKGPTRQELVEAIIKLIQDTVASDTWKDNGGNIGSVRELGGQLIVTQTPENQRALVKLLDQLREQRALQVTIETRFLFVQRNYLDSLGVNFNFSFGNGPGGVAGNIPSPITVTQGSSSFTTPSSLNTPVPGNLATEAATTPNLSTGVTFLSDFQANLVVQATQDEVNSSNLTAPRVTLFNGQRAYVLVSTETAYVSNLTPVVGAGIAAYEPTISIVQSGVVLDVTATISADRKYVTLTLRPTLSVLETPIPSFSVSSFGVGATTIGGVATATTIGASIQEPEIQITSVRTTVSVPDGGTLLLGGQTLSSEVDREAGVPILSDIPFLKRLFTNRGTAKDDQVLLILVKPTIIIQREREQEQFPLLNTAQQ
jgi:type II secretory pathway component GspD/PulD (secretin)